MNKLVHLFILFVLSVVVKSKVINNDRFYYFAYGSNLLARRLHIQNPSAFFISPAKLKDHRLDFNMYTKTWRGAVATIVPDDGSVVWGALWTIESSLLKHLDDQEGVDSGWYFPKFVNVTVPGGAVVEARTYQETVNPPKVDPENIPLERRPSNTYMQVIIDGAIQCGLPPHYIQYLYTFPTNGRVAVRKMLEQLGYLHYAENAENNYTHL